MSERRAGPLCTFRYAHCLERGEGDDMIWNESDDTNSTDVDLFLFPFLLCLLLALVY